MGPEDRVLEVGTGPGTLTRRLSARAREVLTVEVDARILEFARSELSGCPNVRFLLADILDRHGGLAPRAREILESMAPFVWVSNLPYGIATTLIVAVLESGLRWLRAAVTVQSEVADRVVAGPGDPAYGPLTLLVAYWAVARGGRRILPGSFSPPPRVDSRVLLLAPREPIGRAEEYPAYRDWVKCLFVHRRKQLRHILTRLLGGPAAGDLLALVGRDPATRPESLSPEEVLRLSRARPDF